MNIHVHESEHMDEDNNICNTTSGILPRLKYYLIRSCVIFLIIITIMIVIGFNEKILCPLF